VAAAAFVAAAVAFVTGFPAGGPTMAAATGACVPAPILRGAPPPWTSSAWADSPGFRLPYSVASGRSAAAFFWVTLRAGSPTNPANKVLWVMRYPRRGSPLRISARDGAKPALTVRSSWPADSSPGEIYPSYLNLPKPGCWRLTLRWSSHVAHLNVSVVRAKRPSS
jgi:hypothetical protein